MRIVANMAERVRKLFVARLPWTACRVALREYFSQFGEIERTQVVFDQNTGRSKRFGFVIFKDEEGVRKTLTNSHHEIHDTEIFVQQDKNPKSVRRNDLKEDPFDAVIYNEQN